jgi:hypothetical protein
LDESLNLETASFSEQLATIYETTRYHEVANHDNNLHCHKNFKWYRKLHKNLSDFFASIFVGLVAYKSGNSSVNAVTRLTLGEYAFVCQERNHENHTSTGVHSNENRADFSSHPEIIRDNRPSKNMQICEGNYKYNVRKHGVSATAEFSFSSNSEKQEAIRFRNTEFCLDINYKNSYKLYKKCHL